MKKLGLRKGNSYKPANFRPFGLKIFCIKSGSHEPLINPESKTTKLDNSIVLK